jgi:hypothetical protein
MNLLASWASASCFSSQMYCSEPGLKSGGEALSASLAFRRNLQLPTATSGLTLALLLKSAEFVPRFNSTCSVLCTFHPGGRSGLVSGTGSFGPTLAVDAEVERSGAVIRTKYVPGPIVIPDGVS